MKKVAIVDAVVGIIGGICGVIGIVTGIMVNNDIDSKLENEYGLKKLEERENEED